jgi:type IV secretion system protein VirB4
MLTTNNEVLTDTDLLFITQAIQGLYRMKNETRRLCHLASYFGTKRPGSLRARFDQWHSDGEHAWLFDHDKDQLNLNPDIIGFDFTAILSEQATKTPALMYLMHRIEQVLAGERGIIVIEEAWKLLNSEFVAEFINDGARTFRKKNIILGLITQVANDTIDSIYSKAINDSAFTKIFFPNPGADQNVYMNFLGLTEREFELVKNPSEDGFYFLLVHGQGTSKESVKLRLHLPPEMQKHIAIISGRETNLQIFDEAREKVGNHPELLLSEYTNRLGLSV